MANHKREEISKEGDVDMHFGMVPRFLPEHHKNSSCIKYRALIKLIRKGDTLCCSAIAAISNLTIL